MTQEDKELLLKDLCARLPYKTKAIDGEEIITVRAYISTTVLDDVGIPHSIRDVKPYLFPLSSMTHKQRDYIHKNGIGIDIQINNNGIVLSSVEGYEWLNKNHFDYRGLIEKSLALDATGLNIY